MDGLLLIIMTITKLLFCTANPIDSLDEVAVMIMAYCHVYVEVLQCLVTLQLAGNVETNPDPGKLSVTLNHHLHNAHNYCSSHCK